MKIEPLVFSHFAEESEELAPGEGKVITPSKFKEILSTAEISPKQIKLIWSVVSNGKRYLTSEEFYKAIKAVALIQNQKPLSDLDLQPELVYDFPSFTHPDIITIRK